MTTRGNISHLFVKGFGVSMKLNFRLAALLFVLSASMLSASVYADSKKTNHKQVISSKHKDTTTTNSSEKSNTVSPVGNTQVILTGVGALDPAVAARVRYEERLAELEAELEAEEILRQSQGTPVVTDPTLSQSASEL